jgi:hypothetical protein
VNDTAQQKFQDENNEFQTSLDYIACLRKILPLPRKKNKHWISSNY